MKGEGGRRGTQGHRISARPGTYIAPERQRIVAWALSTVQEIARWAGGLDGIGAAVPRFPERTRSSRGVMCRIQFFLTGSHHVILIPSTQSPPSRPGCEMWAMGEGGGVPPPTWRAQVGCACFDRHHCRRNPLGLRCRAPFRGAPQVHKLTAHPKARRKARPFWL